MIGASRRSINHESIDRSNDLWKSLPSQLFEFFFFEVGWMRFG